LTAIPTGPEPTGTVGACAETPAALPTATAHAATRHTLTIERQFLMVHAPSPLPGCF
jgi:hypothetical protein